MSSPIADVKRRLKDAIGAKGITQQELSDATGISKSSISQYIHGYTKPKPENIVKLSRALDVDPGWLMGFDVPQRSTLSTTDDKDASGMNIETEEVNEQMIDDEVKHGEYYTDPRTVEIANNLKDNPGLRLLFDAGKDLPPEDILKTLDFIKNHL